MTTDTQTIVEIVGELVLDDGVTLEQQRGSTALTVARQIESTLAPRITQNPAYAPLWQQFRTAPQEQAPVLAGVLQVLLAADAALARRLDALLDQYKQATGPGAQTINTGGGAYIGGSVTTTGGDFVGRDKVTVTGDGNVIGDRSSATVIRQTGDPEAIARAFKTFYDAVKARPDTSPQDKADLETDLKETEMELAKGDQADEGFITRRLRNIKRMAPDILDVVLAAFANPLASLGVVAKKVADKIKAEAETTSA